MSNPITLGMTMEEKEKKPRKIKFLDESNWLVFEEGDKLFATHFCNGKKDTPHKQQGIKQGVWCHTGLDVEKGGKCTSCEEEMPKHLFMLAKIANAPI